MDKEITIHFLGAAETVTGSKYLIKALGKSILVDCGMFQGLKELRLQNWDYPPINIPDIDVVLLTHGHLDHVGYLPRLVKAGFNKKIMAVKPTLEVAKIILEDSARIQEEDAERANRGGYSKHKPALPLYDLDDVEKTLAHFYPQQLDKWLELFDGIKIRFRYNGHIIGATFIELVIGDKTLVFSGDIGRKNDPLMRSPEQPEKADVLFIESTYGDRIHSENSEEKLIQVIQQAYKKFGTIIIPGFAVERIQLLMFMLWRLKKERAIPDIPIYMDSPMGRNILDIFKNNMEWHKLTMDECDSMCKDITLVQKMEETYELAAKTHPKIIIAGSGMASGGRVLTYFQFYLSNPTATILLAGYQAEGTRGRKMLEGATEIKLYGKVYEVKATVENIEGLSAHADQSELIDWMSKIKQRPEKIFIVHGEKKGAEGLQNKMKEVYGWDSTIPNLYDIVEIK